MLLLHTLLVLVQAFVYTQVSAVKSMSTITTPPIPSSASLSSIPYLEYLPAYEAPLNKRGEAAYVLQKRASSIEAPAHPTGAAPTVTSPPQSTRSAERNSQKNNKARKGLSGGAIAGIVIAVVVVLVLVGLALFFYLRWQREKKRAALSREIAPSPPEAPPDYSAHQTNGEARNGEGEIVDMYRGQNVGAVPPVVEVKKDDDGPRRVTPQEMESGRDAVPRVEVAGDHPIEPGARTAARAELPA